MYGKLLLFNPDVEMYAVAAGAEGEVSSEKDQHAWHGHPDVQYGGSEGLECAAGEI